MASQPPLHAEPKRAPQDGVDVPEGASRGWRMLLHNGVDLALALPPAQDPRGASRSGASGVGSAAASLRHRLRLGAAASALADNDQFLDGHLGEIAVFGELVVPVGDLFRLDLGGMRWPKAGLMAYLMSRSRW